MKVALLTAKPNFTRRVAGHKLYVGEKRPPNGLGFLTAVLREKGIAVEIFDRYCGDTRWPRDDFASYDFVGLYCTTVCSTDIERVVRKARSKIVAVGGPHASLFPEKIPARADYIVRGEAEAIIADLVEGKLERGRIETARLSSDDLDKLPRFPFDIFNGELAKNYDWGFHFNEVKPVFTLNTSRGCPFSCSFCSVRKIWGRRFTAMSAERVFDDIQHVRSLGARGVYFREDNFTVKRSRIVDLCEKLVRSGSDLLWACETRVDTIDGELMALMRRAGCIGFYVGVEHLSQRMLDVFNKQVTVEQILAFFENANRQDIFTHASFVVDHPEERPEDVAERERLLDVIKPSFIVRNRYRADG
jgi:O-antigen biosynthesis protein